MMASMPTNPGQSRALRGQLPECAKMTALQTPIGTWLCRLRVGCCYRLGPVGGSRQRLVSGNTLGRVQSLRLTPRVSSFFAYESLRFVAFAAVSAAAWTALGPFCAAALINPNL